MQTVTYFNISEELTCASALFENATINGGFIPVFLESRNIELKNRGSFSQYYFSIKRYLTIYNTFLRKKSEILQQNPKT